MNSLERQAIRYTWRRYLLSNLDPFTTELVDELFEKDQISWEQYKRLREIPVRIDQVRELLTIVVENVPMSAFLDALDNTDNVFIADSVRAELARINETRTAEPTTLLDNQMFKNILDIDLTMMISTHNYDPDPAKTDAFYNADLYLNVMTSESNQSIVTEVSEEGGGGYVDSYMYDETCIKVRLIDPANTISNTTCRHEKQDKFATKDKLYGKVSPLTLHHDHHRGQEQDETVLKVPLIDTDKPNTTDFSHEIPTGAEAVLYSEYDTNTKELVATAHVKQTAVQTDMSYLLRRAYSQTNKKDASVQCCLQVDAASEDKKVEIRLLTEERRLDTESDDREVELGMRTEIRTGIRSEGTVHKILSKLRIRRRPDSKTCVSHKYDAFIIYSSDDWKIAKMICHVLENEMGMKICIRHRDFPVGTAIAEDIVETTDQSRKVISVCSENFLKSKWCDYEFYMAVSSKSMDDLVAVYVGTLAERNCSRTLKYILKSGICLKYNDENFHRNLKATFRN